MESPKELGDGAGGWGSPRCVSFPPRCGCGGSVGCSAVLSRDGKLLGGKGDDASHPL